jgi:hypothetical protein
MYEIEFFLYGGGRSYEFKPTLAEAREYVRQESKLNWVKVEIHYPKR